ncbi:MAG: nitroreductase family deazaflavin-dependent oxidoreductase [Ktedonobacteraceae bacterium]
MASGSRFLLLTHVGRKSGLPRQSVLEVLGHDRSSDTYIILSGWGTRSDWVRNVEKNPEVFIEVGCRKIHARAEWLSSEEAEQKVLDYAKQNPLAIRILPRMMGFQLDGSEADFRALAQLGVVLAFHPISMAKDQTLPPEQSVFH